MPQADSLAQKPCKGTAAQVTVPKWVKLSKDETAMSQLNFGTLKLHLYVIIQWSSLHISATLQQTKNL